MKSNLFVPLLIAVVCLPACTSQRTNIVHARDIIALGDQAIAVCVAKVKQANDKLLLKEADQAYVYVSDDREWISVVFAHGSLGTFTKRSPDYYMVMGCDATKQPPMKVIVLGRPLQNPIFSAPHADNYYRGEASTFAGSMELLYKRTSGKFRFMAMQRFSIKNLFKHNPNILKKPKCNLKRTAPPPQTPPSPASIKQHPGCYLNIS